MNTEEQSPQETARGFCHAQQWTELLKFTNSWSAKSPNDYLAHYYRGIAFDSLKLSDLSIQSYQQALALNPDDPNVWGNLAISYEGKGQNTEAEHFFTQAYQINPSHRLNGVNLANFLGRSRKHEDAEVLFKRLMLLFPSDLEIARGLMISLCSRGKFDELYEFAEVVENVFPGLTKEISDNYSFNRWKSDLRIIFEEYACSQCRKAYRRRFSDFRYYYKVGALNITAFSKWVWCFDCHDIQQAFFAAQPIDRAKLVNLIATTHSRVSALPDWITEDRTSGFAQAILGPKNVPNEKKVKLARHMEQLEWNLKICDLFDEACKGLGSETVCMRCLSRRTKPIIEEVSRKRIRTTNCSCESCDAALTALYKYDSRERLSLIRYQPCLPDKEQYRQLDARGRVVYESEVLRNQEQVVSGTPLSFYGASDYSSIKDLMTCNLRDLFAEY